MGRNVDAAQAIAEKLQADGIRATIDPRAAHPPCVLISPPSVENERVLCGDASGTATWEIRILGTSPADLDSWRAMDALVDICRARLLPDREQPSVWLPSPDRAPLPCYVLTVVDEI